MVLSDKGRDCVQQFVDRRPDLAVSVDGQVIPLFGKNLFLLQQAVINPGVRDEPEQQSSGLFPRARLIRKAFFQPDDRIDQRPALFFQQLYGGFFAFFFRKMERFQPSSAVNAAGAGIILHIHCFFRQEIRKTRLDDPEHVIPAEIQPENPKKRQEILSVRAHQDRLILFGVKGNARRGKRQRKQGRQRALFAYRNGHVFPCDARAVPVNQRLACMLAFEIGIPGVIHANMRKIGNRLLIKRPLCFFFQSDRIFTENDSLFFFADMSVHPGISRARKWSSPHRKYPDRAGGCFLPAVCQG